MPATEPTIDDVAIDDVATTDVATCDVPTGHVPAGHVATGDAWAPWQAWAPSVLASHDAECCRGARAWFLAMDRSLWRGVGAPGWIRRHYEWGPTRWPLHWCEAVGAKALCCGAQAALSVEAFRARGMDAVPVQLVQRYEAHHLPHWHSRWTEGGANPAWAGAADADVYHEAVAVLDGDRARIWNPTAAAWAEPGAAGGYGGIVAIRIGGPRPAGRTVAWGGAALPLGEWAPAPEAAR
jgi:hypothetical protein